MNSDSSSRHTHPSACPLDCPDGCSLVATVVDGRLVALDGDDRNPLTAGLVCGKVRGFGAHLYCSERVPYPLIREHGAPKGKPGGLRRASWDEALSLVCERIRAVQERHGGQAILPLHYDGSNGALTAGLLDERLFRRLGATKLEKTVCAVPSGVAAGAMYGRMQGIALDAYDQAELIVAWGVNPSSSGIHLLPVVKRARRAGAKLIVIDPRRTKFARAADLHIAPLPGTDLALALALIRWLVHNNCADLAFLARHTTGFEHLKERAEPWTLEHAAETTGCSSQQIELFARLYAQSSPAALRCGWGLERNRNGAQAVCAVLALPSVAGKFGVHAGGYTMSNKSAWKLVDLNRGEPAPPRTLNQVRLGRALTTGLSAGIHFLFVFDHNPAETLPDVLRVRKGLSRPDLFTVVFDAIMTATTQYADVVLPATTFLEHDELVHSYGSTALLRSWPVIAPVGEARPNLQVFAELIERLGLSKPGDSNSPDALVEALLEKHEGVAASLATSGIAQCSNGSSAVQFVDVFPGTSDGKAHLFPEELEAIAPLGLYSYREDPRTSDYPLALISPSTAGRISSTFGQLRRGIVPLEINPEDALERGIEDQATVRVYNEQGEFRTRAKLTDATRPGVVVLPKGLWAHNTLDGNTANVLVPDGLTDIGCGAVYNDTRVEVEALDDDGDLA